MSDWNSFLNSQTSTANIDGDFDPQATYLIPLNQQGILSIKGPDTIKFLQGQVTCDVRELANNQTRLGAQCNIKGRMLLCFLALQTEPEQVFLRIDKGLVANGLASLGKYIVFSKAKLTDATESYRNIGISGPNASKIIKEIFNLELEADNTWQASQNSLIIRIDEQRYECWLNPEQAESIWQKVAKQTTIASPNFWTLLDIQAGLGNITPETFETFTPQAINFQLVNGINFKKGCYTGQEIVARLHYRGTLKRHMYRFEFALNGELPKPGSELRNAAGKSVGEIVIAAKKNAQSGELLASVVDDQRVDIYLPDNPQKLGLLPLPYAIPTPNEDE